jgi:hypothetical protein
MASNSSIQAPSFQSVGGGSDNNIISLDDIFLPSEGGKLGDPDIDDFESDDEHHFQENPTAERKRSRGSQRNMTEEQKVERR